MWKVPRWVLEIIAAEDPKFAPTLAQCIVDSFDRDVKDMPTKRLDHASMPEQEAAKEQVRGTARSMGLNVAGVDMLRSSHGPVVIEVNSSPGLEGIEKATGVDVANTIVRFVERHAKPGRTRTRGKG